MEMQSQGEHELIPRKDSDDVAGLVAVQSPPESDLESPQNSAECSKIEEAPTDIFSTYIRKFAGVEGKSPPKMNIPLQMGISTLLAFCGILLLSITDYFYVSDTFFVHHAKIAVKLLSGAHGATAVLLYEAYTSPLSQPRNVIGSYIVNSVVGVTVRIVSQHIGIPQWVAAAIAVSFGVLGMNMTKTVHPPGGGCALIAVVGGPSIHALGYGYVLTSLGATFIMVAFAVLGNNLMPNRQYPLYWT